MSRSTQAAVVIATYTVALEAGLRGMGGELGVV